MNENTLSNVSGNINNSNSTSITSPFASNVLKDKQPLQKIDKDNYKVNEVQKTKKDNKKNDCIIY